MIEPENWRERILRQFSAWLDNIEFAELPGPQEFTKPPDMFSLFAEFAALRQELALQTRSSRKDTRDMLESLTQVKSDLGQSGAELDEVLRQIKGLLPETRQRAEEALLLEIIQLHQATADNYEQFAKQRLRGFMAAKKDRLMLQNEQKNLGLLLKKSSDLLRRYELSDIAKIGMPFDPACMRAMGSNNNADVPPGCVSKILTQGYKRKEKILTLAEVEVRSN